MVEYTAKFANHLSTAQVTVLSTKSITFFGSCKPSRISVSPGSSSATFDFMQDCITEEELTKTIDRTLGSIHEPNPIAEIKKTIINS